MTFSNGQQPINNKAAYLNLYGQLYGVLEQSETIWSESRAGQKAWTGYLLRRVNVVSGDDDYYITSSWYSTNTTTGTTSKVQYATPSLITIKNVGKANQTTPYNQGVAEFNAMVKKEKDIRAKTNVRPMLANKFEDRKHHVEYPCYVQPKLDGNRMFVECAMDYTTGEWNIVPKTRAGKPYIKEVVAHIVDDIRSSLKNTVWTSTQRRFFLDGEIMLSGNQMLQLTNTAIKKYTPGLSEQLIFYIYDIYFPDSPGLEFHGRLMHLYQLSQLSCARFVPTMTCSNEEEVWAAHDSRVRAGYEGLMVRNAKGLYTPRLRSNDLLKVKKFQDAEFLVVNFGEGKGSFAGQVIFECETKDGETFTVVPEGPVEYKKQLFQNGEQYIGKWLTVRYQTLSLDGKPIFPVGVAFRDEDEIDPYYNGEVTKDE